MRQLNGDEAPEPGLRHRLTHARTALSPDSESPMYRQVQDFLAECLTTGVFPRNRPLPSTRYLSDELGISRNTVALAYQELTALGLLESRPRRGFFPARAAHHPARRTDRSRERTGRVDWSAHLISRPASLQAPGPTHPDWNAYPYPLIPGQPELGRFPVRAWSRALSRALEKRNVAFSLRDAVDADDPLLVEQLCQALLPMRGIHATPEEILITAGAQQGLELVARTMLTTGRRVAMENPGYLDAYQIFALSGASIDFVDWTTQPVRRILDREPDLIYLTPSHQHPTTTTMPYATRRSLLDAAAARDIILIEDDFDSEMRYIGHPTQALKSLDADGRVVHIGTFSKFVAPGIRLGFVVADPALIAAMRAVRRHEVKHPSGLLQRALALYIECGDYQSALRDQRYHLHRKWRLLTERLQVEMPWAASCAPTGGVSFWITGPDHLDFDLIEQQARRRGVLFDAGSRFYFTPDPPRNQARLGITACSLDKIPAAVHILGQIAARQKTP